jgi:hypothetical protein
MRKGDLMRKITALASLVLLLMLLTTPFPSHAQTQRITLFMYAAKFVCGKADDKGIVAPGHYFTAINVHNASPIKKVAYIKRFAIALPEERPGKISSFFGGILGPDEAMGIDCNNIYKHTGQSPGPFLEGYALIYSLGELDVVDIHTAGSREVTTLHTERVPVRRFVVGRGSDMAQRMLRQENLQ